MDNGSGQYELTREQRNVADMINEARKLLIAGADSEEWKGWKFQCNIRSISNTDDIVACAGLLNRAETVLRSVAPYCSALTIPTEPTQ